MDFFLSLITVIVIVTCFLLFGHLPWIRTWVDRSNKGPGKTVPEAAGSWPIIGHLHLLAGNQVLHRRLGSMADKFGPIFTIKLGVHRVLIVSNSAMAKECFTTNDRVFANRPNSMAAELMGHANFAFAPYGPYWREMRKIVVLELMSHRRAQILANIRASEVKKSLRDMHTTWMRNKGSSETVKIDMKQWFGDLIMNMTVRMIFGNRFSPHEQYEDDRFKKAIRRLAELFGAVVPSDAISGLRWFDLGGYEKKMKKTAKEIDVVIDRWLQEHKKKMNCTQQIDDENEDQVFMTALLSRLKEELEEEYYGFSTDSIVKATCLLIFAAGLDSTMVTLTWALALVVNNPVVLQKAQQELANNVGKDRKVNESDLKNLVYLQAIIKETMRLYPAGPLSVPHESTEDCVVGGYTVPKGTRLLVNLWKIQHDPQIWADPFEFQPERFLTSKKEIDVKGQHFELIPFGSGRRICVGISLALESIQLILASLLHEFDIQNPSNEQIDMTESPGITNMKATPLELFVSPRMSPDLY